MIGIVTVNWNGYAITRQLVEDLHNGSSVDYYLVVVNNSICQKGLFDKDELFDSENTTVIHLIENKGYSGGLNAGIKYLFATHQDQITHLLLMNNDLRLEIDFLKRLSLLANDKNTVYSTLILNKESDLVQNTGGRIVTWLGGTINLNKNTSFEQIKDFTPDFLSGCILFMSKDLLLAVGYFDEDYGSYYEDVDFCLRSRRCGYHLEILKSIYVRHFHSYSTLGNGDYKIFLLNRNQIIFARKNLIFPHKEIFIIASIFRGMLFSVFTGNFRSYWKGIIEGLSFNITLESSGSIS